MTWLVYHRSELLITVNYTALGISSTNFRDTAQSSVQVVISLSNDTSVAISQTVPTVLPPGVNLMGILRIEFRQLFKGYVSSGFGLFDVSLWLT
jgi:hypothetical protein